MDVSIGIAFLAGLASFLSPCVFPLVPAYIGYLSGRSFNSTNGVVVSSKRWQTIIHGIAFIVGFSVIFILLGLSFSVLGSLLYGIRDILAKVGGVIVVVFGIHMTGIYRIKFLEYDLRHHTPVSENAGIFSSFLMGIFFSAGWSPCLGPVLASILTIAMNSGDPSKGISLLIAYSIGMGIPFLLAAVGVSWISSILIKFKKAMRLTEIIMGVILIIVGVMLFTGSFALLSQYGNLIDLGI
jgi:cytochrome c-type biogenesis protein